MSLGQRQNRIDRLDRIRPSDLCLATDILHDHRERACILPCHGMTWRIELHTVALDGAAVGNVGVERGFPQCLGIGSAIRLDRARQNVGEEIPGLVETHGRGAEPPRDRH